MVGVETAFKVLQTGTRVSNILVAKVNLTFTMTTGVGATITEKFDPIAFSISRHVNIKIVADNLSAIGTDGGTGSNFRVVEPVISIAVGCYSIGIKVNTQAAIVGLADAIAAIGIIS